MQLEWDRKGKDSGGVEIKSKRRKGSGRRMALAEWMRKEEWLTKRGERNCLGWRGLNANDGEYKEVIQGSTLERHA